MEDSWSGLGARIECPRGPSGCDHVPSVPFLPGGVAFVSEVRQDHQGFDPLPLGVACLEDGARRRSRRRVSGGSGGISGDMGGRSAGAGGDVAPAAHHGAARGLLPLAVEDVQGEGGGGPGRHPAVRAGGEAEAVAVAVVERARLDDG